MPVHCTKREAHVKRPPPPSRGGRGSRCHCSPKAGGRTARSQGARRGHRRAAAIFGPAWPVPLTCGPLRKERTCFLAPERLRASPASTRAKVWAGGAKSARTAIVEHRKKRAARSCTAYTSQQAVLGGVLQKDVSYQGCWGASSALRRGRSACRVAASTCLRA